MRELAVFHDNNSRETEAIPYYERALDHGLDAPTRSKALVWLASSLYKTGRSTDALHRIHEARVNADAELQRFLHGLERRLKQDTAYRGNVRVGFLNPLEGASGGRVAQRAPGDDREE